MSDNLTAKLQEIKDRADEATEGPWKAIKSPVDIERIYIWAGDLTEIARIEGTTDNTEFIASSRTDIPRLLAVIEKLIEQRDEWLNTDYKGDEIHQADMNAEILDILEGKP